MKSRLEVFEGITLTAPAFSVINTIIYIILSIYKDDNLLYIILTNFWLIALILQIYMLDLKERVNFAITMIHTNTYSKEK